MTEPATTGPDLRLAILCGPASPEDRAYYDVTSAADLSSVGIAEGLVEGGWPRPVVVDVTTTPDWLSAVGGCDLALVNLHGTPGEDGTVQAVLESAGIAYAGSGVEASVLALNKHVAKLVAVAEGVPTPRWQLLRSRHDAAAWPAAQTALLKPVRGGSSRGIRPVTGPVSDVPFDGSWLVEEWVGTRDVTVCVVDVDGRATALGAVALDHERAWLDELTKLEPDRVGRATPTRPTAFARQLQRCSEHAVAMHEALGCRDVSRSDFVVSEHDAWFLELNTLPGLSPGSYAASCAATAGLTYPDFLGTIVRAALRRRPAPAGSP